VYLYNNIYKNNIINSNNWNINQCLVY
jgi:hypothetical protein